MRLPSTVYTSRSWRIHELTSDFRLEDVWALPTPGGRDDLARLATQIASGDPSSSWPAPARVLWDLRWRIGARLGWDDDAAGLGARVATLRDRMPRDLADAPPGPGFATLPFRPLYLLEDEWAAEIANRTAHAVLHVGWVPDDAGGYHGQLAVLVKPNGRLGRAYMTAIAPLRHRIVYPTMLAGIARRWQMPAGRPAPEDPAPDRRRMADEMLPIHRRRVPTTEPRGSVAGDLGPEIGGPAVLAREIPVPADARMLSASPHVDYENALLVDVARAPDLTGEQWARAVLEDAPADTRQALLEGWSSIGLELGPTPSDGHVLGWRLRRGTPDAVLLGADAPVGLHAELLVRRQPDGLLFASFVHLTTDAARQQWAQVEGMHTPLMRLLLEQAVTRVTQDQ
ncbi:DUF2867 domain-containing protein [Frankia sp. CNm7]|uniref:DUF2867 domain-containing protein n=1 Tax=Frankia nepalensis TaxID=1836974 RepID=A0A937UTR0_9ACTN|nr:DUF2867 domain-containing protein [Frankia nepalensis]MBL7499372.1 DUF2867 domain-containing protein [Frankia nepalensis]MBL7512813.1 DUF2867 domain-containing protein [Frankia nepalensis]MBL7521797.1 DUF2867 domain-containing protein [Frankia nepalensis]MBL7631515.1 DUF2867 domain-containing protein [Frankia nepalensis]